MGYSIDLLTWISFNREHFDSKDQVEEELYDVKKSIQRCQEDLISLSLITEPKKYCEEDDDPIWFIQNRVKETIENLEELCIRRFKLVCLLEDWDKCYDKDGYAKPLPDGVTWDSAFIAGDFVKYKDNEEEI